MPDGPIHVGSHSTMRVRALLPYTLDWDVTVARHEPPREQEVSIKVTLGGRFGMHGRIRFSFEPQSGWHGHRHQQARDCRGSAAAPLPAPDRASDLHVQPPLGDEPGRAALASHRRRRFGSVAPVQT